MRIEYVRVYQREGETKLGCDPADHPTAQYINESAMAVLHPRSRADLSIHVVTSMLIQMQTLRHGIKQDTPFQSSVS
jgi:hypothetical protein